MAKTASDVVSKAMRRINYIAAGEAPDATDYNEGLQEYEGFHAWLLKEFPRDVHWSSDAVPDEYWTHVAGWFSAQLAETLNVADDNEGLIQAKAAKAELRFREMLARRTIKRVVGEYY